MEANFWKRGLNTSEASEKWLCIHSGREEGNLSLV